MDPEIISLLAALAGVFLLGLAILRGPRIVLHTIALLHPLRPKDLARHQAQFVAVSGPIEVLAAADSYARRAPELYYRNSYREKQGRSTLGEGGQEKLALFGFPVDDELIMVTGRPTHVPGLKLIRNTTQSLGCLAGTRTTSEHSLPVAERATVVAYVRKGPDGLELVRSPFKGMLLTTWSASATRNVNLLLIGGHVGLMIAALSVYLSFS